MAALHNVRLLSDISVAGELAKERVRDFSTCRHGLNVLVMSVIEDRS